jgi:hypothetical protein
MISKIKHIDIELQPQGWFLLTLTDADDVIHKVKGRFSMYALNRFCETKNVTYLQLIGKITLGMKIVEYAELVLMALEDMYRKDIEQCRLMGERWTTEMVMDLIFEPLGFGNKKALDFFQHAIGRVTEIVEETPAPPDDKKKSKRKAAA